MAITVSSIKKKIDQNPFLKNVSILTLGTVFAQGLGVLALPLLTRLYTPEDFSVLAVYAPMVAIVSTVACLRFNIAIPIAEDDEDGVNLLSLCVVFSILFAVVLGMVAFTIPAQTIDALGLSVIQPYFWMIPTGVLFASMYNALQYWAIREKRFGLVTKTRITRAIGGVGTQVGIGWYVAAPFGLLLGHMLYAGLGTFGIAKGIWFKNRHLLSRISISEMKASFARHRRFPKYSVAEALFDVMAVQLPVLIIATLLGGALPGQLLIAMAAIGAPMSLIGAAIGQVFLSEASKKNHEGSLGTFTLHVMRNSFVFGAVPLLLVGATAPLWCSFVFGVEWERTGWIILWLTPWFVLQFVFSPVSGLYAATGRQKTFMNMQILSFVMRVGLVSLVALFNPIWMIEAFAVSSAAFNAYALVLTGRIAHGLEE